MTKEMFFPPKSITPINWSFKSPVTKDIKDFSEIPEIQNGKHSQSLKMH